MLFPCGDSSLLSPRLTVEACSKRCQRHPRESLATAVLLYVIKIQYIVIQYCYTSMLLECNILVQYNMRHLSKHGQDVGGASGLRV